MISQPFIDELMKQAQELKAYVIMMHQGHSWYFHNLREHPVVTGVIWTPRIQDARLFIEEEEVEEFKMKFISPRKVQILKIERDELDAT